MVYQTGPSIFYQKDIIDSHYFFGNSMMDPMLPHVTSAQISHAEAFLAPDFQQTDIWLVVWNIFYFPIYWECHHPNWLSYFSEGWPNHQPDMISWKKLRDPFDNREREVDELSTGN